jgi:serine protease Do
MSTDEVVEKVEASVVAIVINYRQTATYGFQTYYRDAQAAGSGVIVSQDGYIVTNNHVISGAETITVTLSDGTAYEAELIGTDETTDLALIKIEATGLQAADIGSSEELKRGQTAIIIGNPLGYLEGSVSSGVNSGLDRTLTFSDGTTIYHMIQTDASVNPGNSGGGLFNDRGQLVGIVSAKTSSTEIEGLGFAIPSEVFKDIINDLYTYGYVKGRPALGIATVSVTSPMEAMYYGLSRTGLYVQSFISSEVEANSELKIGDCIVAINGTEVSSNAEVLSLIAELEIGDTVEVGVYRDNEFITVKTTLIEQDENY